MTHKEILRLICELSHAGNTRDFARLVEKAHPSDTAEALAELPVSTTLCPPSRRRGSLNICPPTNAPTSTLCSRRRISSLCLPL